MCSSESNISMAVMADTVDFLDIVCAKVGEAGASEPPSSMVYIRMPRGGDDGHLLDGEDDMVLRETGGGVHHELGRVFCLLESRDICERAEDIK